MLHCSHKVCFIISFRCHSIQASGYINTNIFFKDHVHLVTSIFNFKTYIMINKIIFCDILPSMSNTHEKCNRKGPIQKRAHWSSNGLNLRYILQRAKTLLIETYPFCLWQSGSIKLKVSINLIHDIYSDISTSSLFLPVYFSWLTICWLYFCCLNFCWLYFCYL